MTIDKEENGVHLCRILVVDDEEDIRVLLEGLLTGSGYRVQIATDAKDAMKKIESHKFNIVLTDIKMPGMDGMALTSWIKKISPETDVIIMTGHASIETAIEAVRLGAFDYLLKPFPDIDLVYAVIKRGVYKQKLESDLKHATEALRQSQESFINIVDKSHDGILIVDSKGIIRYLNPNASVMLDSSHEKLINSPFNRTLVTDRREQLAIIRLAGGSGVAEMSIQETSWNGKAAYLLSLRDITDLKTAESELRHMATHDPLTNLPNRNLLCDRLTQTIKQANRHAHIVALLMLDLDGFKEVNDTFGHDIGDLLLKKVSNSIISSVREYDTVSRIGGDEFMRSKTEYHGLTRG